MKRKLCCCCCCFFFNQQPLSHFRAAMNLCQYLTSGKTMHKFPNKAVLHLFSFIMETRKQKKKYLHYMCVQSLFSHRKPLKFSKPKMVTTTTTTKEECMCAYSSVVCILMLLACAENETQI